MAQQTVRVDQETFSCFICEDLPKDPMTIPCGHSYCMNCIKTHWDEEDQKRMHSCPQCRKTFEQTALVEQLKKTGLHAAPADHCYAGPEDVACDICIGRKRKAFRSCLFCLASFCEKHLQPHYDSDTLKEHKLVEPTKNLQKNVCSRHNKLLEIFCCTDQKFICYLCSVDEHKDHNTVSAAAERTERQRELEERRRNIHQGIQDREEDVKLLQQEVEAINHSADKTMEDSKKIFTELNRLLQKRSSDVKHQIRSQQETEVSRVKDVQEKLEQEITELKRKDAELEQLSHTEDHNQFLLNYPSLPALSESTHSSSINIRPLRHFEDVTAAVSELRDLMMDILRDSWTNISLMVPEDDLITEPEPTTRAGFLKYSHEITLDPNTANTRLALSEGNRKVTLMQQHPSDSTHPDRFTDKPQVLSRESLTGRRYWEVEWSGKLVRVAVAYNSTSRAGRMNKSLFGGNGKSWALTCSQKGFNFCHNEIWTSISGPVSSRLGVYLNHGAGLLSFYSVSETMTLIHRVQTRFTQPLHAGVYVGEVWDSAQFCKPR